MLDDILILALGGLLLIGTPEIVAALDPPIYYRPPPAPLIAADLPVSLRHENYAGGSCMYAAAATTLEQGGRSDMANWLTRNHRGAAGIEDIERAFARSKTPYKSTVRGDVAVLDFASRTRRHAAIYYKPGHAITFIGWSRRNGKEWAILVDNNNTRKYEFVRRDLFLNNWRMRYGGGAIVPLYSPVPSQPYNPRDYEVKI